MITLKEWMELVDYKITEGSDYGWNCFGSNAYSLDSWNGDHEGHNLTITFDQGTQTVYEVQVHDYKNNRAYRMINPDYVEAYETESKSRNVSLNEAWDNVEYVDLDVNADFLEKAAAIIAGEDYDTNVMVELDVSDEEFIKYARMAHEQNITFNEFVNRALQSAIDNRVLFND